MPLKKDEQYTRKPSGWYKGCGCGEKRGELVTPPEGSVEGLVRVRIAEWTSPTTQQKYRLEPAFIAIDLLPEDYTVLKELGHISDAPTSQGFKGYLARIA